MRDTTKNLILNKFNKLLETYPFEKLTVDIIAKESGISKSTFYRYFLDKYDVMNFSYKRLVDGLFKSPECHNWREMFWHLANASREDAPRLKNAYDSAGVNSYAAFLYKYSYEAVRAVTLRCRGTDLDVMESCRLSHFCYGTVGAIREWVSGNFDMTDDEMADVLYQAMPETLRDLW